MKKKNTSEIIIQNQNIQNNNGCLIGLLGLFILGVILAILEAFAPLIGIAIGLILGSWIGYIIGPGNDTNSFRQNLYQLRTTNWKNFNEVDDITKQKLYYLCGFAIPLGVVGFYLGRGMFSA